MNEQATIPANEVSFKDFLFKDKRNKRILIFAGIAIVVQFAVFKYFYPFASFIHGDSFSYLEAAYRNLSINTYMVGYSNFLRLISIFTKSDTVLVFLQYLLVQASALFFLYTVFYFYKPSKTIQLLLTTFFLFNPLLVHLSNLISSDCIFLALSFIWFTTLLWLLHRPARKHIYYHLAILFILFTLRYNALVYPFISISVFLVCKTSRMNKYGGIIAVTILCSSFILFTSYKYKQLTGSWQYSPFSGWQWANNAMYSYRYVKSAAREPVPNRFKALDNLIRSYFDTSRNVKTHPIERVKASTYYMWSQGLPLFRYRDSLFKRDSTASELKKWASMGPLYKDYGIHIISTYPLHHLRHFILPNFLKYYAPPVEFLSKYNSGKDSVSPIAQIWFEYKSPKLSTRMNSKNARELDFYPILAGITNIVFVASIISFLLLEGLTLNRMFSRGLKLATAFWIINAAFTILASSAALRFQSFPILYTFTFTLVLIDWIGKIAFNKVESSRAPIAEENFVINDKAIA